MRQRIMAQINRSSGVLNQAADAVKRIAQLEKQRRTYLSRGYVVPAARTLDGMAAAFGAAPTLEELQNALKNTLGERGDMVSGRAYHDRLKLQTYSITSQSPERLDEYVRAANLKWVSHDRTQTDIPKFVQGGVQAAAYHYMTRQERTVGSGLGAVVPMSTADTARLTVLARKRGAYLTAAAALSGLGLTEAEAARQEREAQDELCKRFPDKCKTSKAAATAAGTSGINIGPINIGDLLKQAEGMGGKAYDHVKWWVLGTLNNWGWAQKKDVVWAWCQLPPVLRFYSVPDGRRPIYDSFRQKADNVKWAWDSDWDCGVAPRPESGTSSYQASRPPVADEFGPSTTFAPATYSTGNNARTQKSDGGNTTLIIAGVALAGIALLAMRK